MDDYKNKFKSCGEGVNIQEGVFIEHPEVMEMGDCVTFMRGFYMMGKPGICKIGSNVTFYPNCFIHGSNCQFIIEDHVRFYPGNYFSLGDGETSFVKIGHHSHFAPNCVLYGWGGLELGAYCAIAAHTVFATVGYHTEIMGKPMALSGSKEGPITLEEDVWVAANCTITAHTTIAKGCIIAANAVVTHDTQPMGIYAGVPAKRIRDRGHG